MRTITQHHTNPANEAITVRAMSVGGAGGAPWIYAVHVPGQDAVELHFQNGPITVAEDGTVDGVNGITHEVLLAILIDRLNAFQAGPYECKANALALECLEQALTHLHSRTLERQARGVEGSHGL